MESKEIAELLTKYDNTLHEIDRLEEYKKEILDELLNTKLPDGNKIEDIIETRLHVVSIALKANYPEESKYIYRCFGIAKDLEFLKKHKDNVKESRRWEPRLVPGDIKSISKPKPRWWNELTM